MRRGPVEGHAHLHEDVRKAAAPSKVALVPCDSYDRDEVGRAVSEALGLLGGVEAFLPERGVVLVKPNMLSARPADDAVTTHPEVVRAVAELFRRAGADVAVGDSPGRGSVLGIAEECGIAAACRETGTALVSLDGRVEVGHPSGRICKQFVLARAVVEAGAIVNVAKMKTHRFMTYTGAVKNLFGCIPGTEKARMHLRYQDPRSFATMLLDLADAIRPRLSILDAVVAMDGDGPSHGRVRRVGAILASADPVALDLVAMHLVGADPARVPYLGASFEARGAVGRHSRDAGQGFPSDVEVVGAALGDLAVDDFELPPAARATSGVFAFVRAVRKHVTARPRVDESKCAGCAACAQACPPHGISIGPTGKARIDDRACIRCFCCHEMCPTGAISLRRGLLARIADWALDHA